MEMYTHTKNLITFVGLACSLLQPLTATETLHLTLKKAIETALIHNEQLKIGHETLQIAHTRRQQAQSARYPKIDLSLGLSRRDQDIDYRTEGSLKLPKEFSDQMALSAADVQDELSAMLSNTPKQHEHLQAAYDAVRADLVPSMELPFDFTTTTLGRDSATARIALSYALYTGGRVESVMKQASLNEAIASEELRKHRSEVVFRTRKAYYRLLLAQKVEKEIEETLIRLETVSDLTEAFYKGESLQVKKTDYLRTLVTVDLARSMLEESRASVQLAESALLQTLGLPYDTHVVITDRHFPPPASDPILDTLIRDAYRFNPDYAKIKLAVEIADKKIEEHKSGYLPSIGLHGDATHFYNSYDGGLYTEQNRNAWTIGVGLTWNLFNGYLDRQRIEEARAEKRKRNHMELLLQRGLALRIKAAFLQLDRSRRQHTTLQNAKEHAAQNADLHIRAYREAMVSTKDVIEAQLTEAFAKIAYYRCLADYAIGKASIDFLIGRSLETSGE